MTRIPPPYFDEVRNQSRTRWEQLERDPVLAGPWWQLFKQVQSPRHVLSELLQNADDAGAKKAWASLKDGVFVFEHDGEDFKKEDFDRSVDSPIQISVACRQLAFVELVLNQRLAWEVLLKS